MQPWECGFKDINELHTCEKAIIGGGAALVVVVLAACVLTCMCIRRRRRRSHAVTSVKSATNDYRIESLHTDVTDEYTSSVMRTDNVEQQDSNTVEDFQPISLMVPDSEDCVLPYDRASLVVMAQIKIVSELPPDKEEDKKKSCKRNPYDEVLPNKVITLQLSTGEHPNSENSKNGIEDFVLPCEGASGIAMLQIKNLPELPEKKGVKNKLSNQNDYDEIVPTKGAIRKIPAGEHPKAEAGESDNHSYSVVQPRAAMLSNVDTRAQGKQENPNHKYHLLDGPSPNEPGVVEEAGGSMSMASVLSSEQFLRNLNPNKISPRNLQQSTTHYPRRTTLSYFPTASNIFDDPTYENIIFDTATSSIAGESRGSNIYGQVVDLKLKELPAVPTRSRSMVLNRYQQKAIPAKQEIATNVIGLGKDGVVSDTVKLPSSQPQQVSSYIFDDPKYSKGLNLSDSR